jgi:hypothetical protein
VRHGHRYLVYGICIESAFGLTSIQAAPDADCDDPVRLVAGTAEFFAAHPLPPLVGDDEWLRYGVLADGSVHIRDDEVFETVVSADGGRAVCRRLGRLDDRTFEASLLNFVVSTSLTLRGEEPLHATVVDLDGRAVGLLGPSGVGKSTLAASLIGQGADLVTDDLLRLTFESGRAIAHPGPYRLKLFEEPAQRLLPVAAQHGEFGSLSGKVLMQPSPVAPSPEAAHPLAALFWLGDSEEEQVDGGVTARRLTGMAVAKALIASTMNIRYHAPDRLSRQLRFAERVSRVLPVYALRYRRDYGLLDQVTAYVRGVARA